MNENSNEIFLLKQEENTNIDDDKLSSSKRNFSVNENDIDDFLWFPFSFEDFDKKDIEDRINLLKADNMFITF